MNLQRLNFRDGAVEWTDDPIHQDIFEYIKLWDTQYCGKAWFANPWRGKRWHQRRRIKRFWQ